MNNETMQLLYNRKSVRAYEKQPIPEADVQAILRAAVEAPTAGNMTLWSAIRVTDEAKKKRLSETCDNQPLSRPRRWCSCSARITSAGMICSHRLSWARRFAGRARAT